MFHIETGCVASDIKINIPLTIFCVIFAIKSNVTTGECSFSVAANLDEPLEVTCINYKKTLF